MKTFDYTSNPTSEPGLSADEFTAFLAQERLERTLANIARRAENLREDGYVIAEPLMCSHTICYMVRSPRGDEYQVHIEIPPVCFGDTCTCPAFLKFGDCKHHIAIQMMRAEAEQAAAWDACLENAEGPNGTDPYARY